VRRQKDFAPMLAAAAQKTFEGLVLFTDQLTIDGWSQVAEFAAKRRVATVCEFDFLAKAGCLVSYGPSRAEFTQRVLLQMERVLKGAKPADLPMTQVTRFYLTVNLKTAKALGIKLPQSILARADSIFE
jgi:putative ABC transport system substrate-binding protein